MTGWSSKQDCSPNNFGWLALKTGLQSYADQGAPLTYMNASPMACMRRAAFLLFICRMPSRKLLICQVLSCMYCAAVEVDDLASCSSGGRGVRSNRNRGLPCRRCRSEICVEVEPLCNVSKPNTTWVAHDASADTVPLLKREGESYSSMGATYETPGV